MSILKEIFLKNLKSQILSEKNSLVQGAGENYSEVEKLRGRIQGLEWALSEFEEIVKNLMISEELLEED